MIPYHYRVYPLLTFKRSLRSMTLFVSACPGYVGRRWWEGGWGYKYEPVCECFSGYDFLISCPVKVVEITDYLGTKGDLEQMKTFPGEFDMSWACQSSCLCNRAHRKALSQKQSTKASQITQVQDTVPVCYSLLYLCTVLLVGYSQINDNELLLSVYHWASTWAWIVHHTFVAHSQSSPGLPN